MPSLTCPRRPITGLCPLTHCGGSWNTSAPKSSCLISIQRATRLSISPVSRKSNMSKQMVSQPIALAFWLCYMLKDREGLLNMNLHTSIAVKMDEFDFIDVEDKHHIIINVKDFRAILQHACTTSGSLSAYYSEPWCPLKFSYEENGMQCEFILVTSGNRANNEPPKKQKTRTRQGTARPVLASGATNATLAKNNEQPSQPVQVASQMNETVFPASEQPPTARTGVETWPDFDMRPPPVPPSLMRTETRARMTANGNQ